MAPKILKVSTLKDAIGSSSLGSLSENGLVLRSQVDLSSLCQLRYFHMSV